MKWQFTAAMIAAISIISTSATAQNRGNPHEGWVNDQRVTVAVVQPRNPHEDWPILIRVQLGTAAGDMIIMPRDVVFDKGEHYRLVLINPSNVEHRFSVASFSPSVRTNAKPEIDKGKIIGRAYLTGRVPSGYFVREIDIAAGGMAKWEFTPLWSRIAKVGCTIDSHIRAGMTGSFSVL